jgi:hypothetical protein
MDIVTVDGWRKKRATERRARKEEKRRRMPERALARSG